MAQSVLRQANVWVPLLTRDATRLGLSCKPLEPLYTSDHIGTVCDQSYWLETTIDGWTLAYRVVDQRGQPIIAELRIFPRQKGTGPKWPPGQWPGTYGGSTGIPPGGITARLLRLVQVRKGVQTHLRRIIDRWAKERPGLIDLPRPQATGIQAGSRPGRKGRPDGELAQIALAYQTAYLDGRPAGAAVSRRFSLSLSQARDAIHRARIRGILSPATKQGRVGGTLTPLGKTLL